MSNFNYRELEMTLKGFLKSKVFVDYDIQFKLEFPCMRTLKSL